MTKDDIIRMAREAGFVTDGVQQLVYPKNTFHISCELERFAQLVAAAEREACAKVCEEYNFGQAPALIQSRIRARGQK